MSLEAVKGKFATLTGKDDAVLSKMAQTFKGLCKEADFSITESQAKAINAPGEEDELPVESPALESGAPSTSSLAFSHTIYINLPATRDVAVYDAIFRSLREHLL